MYLKAQNVEILVQIVYATFKKEREKDNGYTGCKKWRKYNFFILKMISATRILLLCCSTTSKLLPSIVRDTWQ